jgi:hypothetical protein
MKKNNINKKNIVIIIGIFLVFTILLSLSSLAYYTNIGKWLDEQENSYVDGEGQKRLAEDFIVDGCGSETMLDTVTGLCWDKNLNRHGTSTWSNAVSDCDGSTHAGHSDWRLPQRDELMTLVDLIGGDETTCSTLGVFGFTGCQNSRYWSATTYQPNTGSAWIVYFNDGYSGNVGKTSNSYVACVRRN